jgi:hypothetical protein
VREELECVTADRAMREARAAKAAFAKTPEITQRAELEAWLVSVTTPTMIDALLTVTELCLTQQLSNGRQVCLRVTAPDRVEIHARPEQPVQVVRGAKRKGKK